ncbi:alpha/beta fold hydrolase [Pseudomonas paraeruginosa]|uniref:alpha/beta fold hydrolase n=1 Tax=Pseudomonas aeruginosa group TaxID=136841 RepID=UPI00053EA086|nr:MULTISPECIES: alpha/beta fold hydrolase [Pseudomonas aeruginosa group]KAB0752655.1 alpha/beta fold hydrolase [Pseudomonas aeruginosa]MBG4067235.1 alpha/beta fold hydrolase [Pseudomonas aeruginosa]MBG5598556.1 alpha/beta fold hydrolase [Pseudomonas aeruginosa]MBH3674254.1 alpha/beta fold hydrolase [Pseudomonas aeruginosa]MBH9432719.1 alpha/beta fold hydrolase [Pseudomonas aeruginosa]
MKRFLLGLLLLLAVAAGVLYFVPATLLASVRTVERGLAGLSEHSVQVDNLEIAYLEGGSEKNPTLLLIHGFGADKDNWLRFARPLTERYHVVALDLPGFGDSSKPQQASYDVGTQAERVANFAAAIGVRRLHLAGNSMGGHIAALYAARHPEQVLSLALIDNAGVMPARKSELFEDLERGENPLVVRQPEDFQKLLDFVFVQQPPLPAPLKRYLGERAVAASAFNAQIFEQLRQRYIPLEPELPKIEAPTLLLWGDRDRVLDVSSIEVMRPLLKRPSVVIMENCGHVPMVERPEETAQHYQAFLDGVRNAQVADR